MRPPPFYISQSVFMTWDQQTKINYLSLANLGGCQSIHRKINNNTVELFFPTLRKIKVSKKEYPTKKEAITEATRILNNAKSKATL